MSFDEVIRSVFQPSKESIGKRLFKKMKRNAKLEQVVLESLYPNEDDCKIRSNMAQTNKHGLGYKGMLNPNEVYSDFNKRSEQSSSFSAVLKSGRKLKITGEAFGYGALEDDDAMDIYSNEDLSQYDFELGSQNTDIKNKKKFNYNQGMVQLEGFVKFKDNINLFLQIKQKYALPQLPKDWRPKKISTSTEKKSRWDNQSKSDCKSDLVENKSKVQKTMNANLRAVILGENIIHKTGVAKEKPQTSLTNTELEFNKELKSSSIVPISIPKTPLSGYFASKFTRSSTTINEEPLTAGLNKLENLTSSSTKERIDDNEIANNENKAFIRTVYEWHPHKILCKRFGIQNPYPQFSDIVGIVCMNQEDKSRNMINRLNAKNQMKTLFTNIFENINTNQSIKDSSESFEDDIQEKKVEQLESPKIEIQPKNDEIMNTEENDQSPKKPRPSINLFKSIFASDDEDEEEEKTESNLTETVKDKTNDNRRNNIGIFSGIDFDLLENFNPRMNAEKNANDKNENGKHDDNNDNNEDDDDDCYGPVLPATIQPIDPIFYLNNLNRSPKRTKNRKEKKLKKKKSSKSKNKSKHKVSSSKRKRSNSSTSSTSNYSDNNIDDNSVEDKIFEMIKKIKNRK